MSRCTVPFTGLRKGDDIVALAGVPVDPPQTVAYVNEDGVRLVEPPGTLTKWWLYGEHDMYLTIEREDPPAVQPTDEVLEALALAKPQHHVNFRFGKPRAEQYAAPGGRSFERDHRVGDIVLIPIAENWQAGVVTQLGPKRVRVRYTTKHGVKYRGPGRFHHPYVPRAHAVVVSGEDWTLPIVAKGQTA